MSGNAPLVDPRSAAALAADIREKLRANVDGLVPDGDQASAALISIVSRFGELVIDRLNQAPGKSLLAFLDLLGAAPLPPVPARVPLTFTVAAGSSTDAVVPAGTQVAAVLAEGEKTPVIFETERELTAVAASLQALVAVDAERDLIADHSALLGTMVPKSVRAFAGDRPNEHVLYIAHGALLSSAITTLTLEFESATDNPAAPDVRELQWEAWDGVAGIPLAVSDTTDSLRVAGVVTVEKLAAIPEQTVNGVRSRWLRVRLLTPVSPGTAPAQGMVRAEQLPVLADIRVSASIDRAALVPELAFANGQAVDVTRAFLPFGDKPRIGDVFYIGHREALGQPGGSITLDVSMVNPRGSTGSIPATDPPDELRLKWEVWDGSGWALLGLTSPDGAVEGGLVDGSAAFTASGEVKFTLPSSLAPTTVNGVTSNWIRVQLTAGNYGVDAQLVPDADAPGGFRLLLATFKPPMVSALALSFGVTTTSATPDAVLAFNNDEFRDIKGALAAKHAAPFRSFPPQRPAVFAAFALPPARKSFPNRTVSLYHGVRLPPYGEPAIPLSPELSVQSGVAGGTVVHRYTLTNDSSEEIQYDFRTLGGSWASSVEPPQLKLPAGFSSPILVTVTVPPADLLPGADASDRGFLTLRLDAEPAVHSVAFETRVGNVSAKRRELRLEYWNGGEWAKLVASDGTETLTRPGVIEFLGPADFAPSRRFGVDGYWIRALLETGDDPPVQLRTLLPNTTFATQSVTVRNEVLGSSDASADQRFRTTRSPLLADPQLEVREDGPLWVRWVEVADFHGSNPDDRHFVLDHIAGEVRFGDGVQGRIPPRGVGNIRMARYRTGGGERGNRAPGTIVQLKNTVPYVERVINVEAAEGGVAAESTPAMLSRAPRLLRHGGRAVAIEDYEDLARSASPEVARAKAVSVRNLRDDPLSNESAPGAVSVVIVPKSGEAKPMPSIGLVTLVENHLRRLSTPTASLAVVAPVYVRVDVSVEVALTSLTGATEVEDAVRRALSGFLHPLTGGRDGSGWDFGRQPYLSDLYAVVSDVPGVDHIRHLSTDQVEEPADAFATGRFLVYSGRHQIALTFVGAE